MSMDYTNIKTGYTKNEKNGVLFFSVPSIDETGFFVHGFSSRFGGVSPAPYHTLNLSLTREENRSNVAENYRRFAQALGVEVSDLAVCNYEHGVGVARVSEADRGAGILRKNDLPPCDGVFTNSPLVVPATLHADCVPLLFACRQGRAAGTAHAGWRGTLHGMAGRMVRAMRIPPADLLVGVGPSIGPCCFEVQEDVGGAFAARFGPDIRRWKDGRQYVDLARATVMTLLECGVPAKNITVSGLCTHCESALFFSHRRDRGKTGAMAEIIAIKNRI